MSKSSHAVRDATADGRSRHVLTVLHAAERTGPPLLALRFLRWLREERPAWQLSTLFLAPGDLHDEFAVLGTVLVDAPVVPDAEQHPRLARGIRHRRIRRTLSQLGHLDLAHVHCVGSMRSLPLLPRAPVLCHVHELSVGQDFHLGAEARKHLRRASRFVAVADAVRDEFVERFGVDADLVERQYGFVDEESLAEPDQPSPVEAPDGATVVMSSGVRHWRKAPELFARIAQVATSRHPDVAWHFVWVGGRDDTGIEHLLQSQSSTSPVRFVPHQPDPLRWLAAADIFLLPAREDAFPLVCVESAALGVPIVSFDSGGTAELVRNGRCGIVVDFPDVVAAADALADLARNPARRAEMSRDGYGYARKELVLSHAAPQLLATIERTMGSS